MVSKYVSVILISIGIVTCTIASVKPAVSMSHVVRKPTFCICETKAQIIFAVTVKLISAFVFATLIVCFIYFLNPKFPVTSHLLCLYSSVCLTCLEITLFHDAACALNLREGTLHKQTEALWLSGRVPDKGYHISKTCPCNIQRMFLAGQIENFI